MFELATLLGFCPFLRSPSAADAVAGYSALRDYRDLQGEFASKSTKEYSRRLKSEKKKKSGKESKKSKSKKSKSKKSKSSSSSSPSVTPSSTPTSLPSTSPSNDDDAGSCISATVGTRDDGTTKITVAFNYADPDRVFVDNCDERDPNCPITDHLTPLPSDFIGFYPCGDQFSDPLPFAREPAFWAYTCYDRSCRKDALPTAKIAATVIFADDSIPDFGSSGIYKTIAQVENEGGGCYTLLLNRIDGFSPPPYYNICKGNEIMLPDKNSGNS